MANEISIAITLSAAKSGAALSLTHTAAQDMSGSDMTQLTQELTTTPELVVLGDVATPAAYVFIKNLETETNDIICSLQSDGSQPFSRIKPGKAILISPETAQNIYLAASTSTARAQIGAIEL